MCLILDTNKYNDFLNPANEDMQPVREWLETKGKLAYAPTSKMARELKNHHKMWGKFEEYRRNGKLKQADTDAVAREKSKLPNRESNDPDIIALAKVAKVKILISADVNLQVDFQEIIKGKIYTKKKHKHLLRADTCP